MSCVLTVCVCVCVIGLAVRQLATASVCQVHCQTAFVKDPRASNILASVL